MPLQQAPQQLCPLGLDQAFDVTLRPLGGGFRPQLREQRLELLLGCSKGF
jgi:ribosomal protein L6P/L9E